MGFRAQQACSGDSHQDTTEEAEVVLREDACGSLWLGECCLLHQPRVTSSETRISGSRKTLSDIGCGFFSFPMTACHQRQQA